jgi:hypothetical protein
VINSFLLQSPRKRERWTQRVKERQDTHTRKPKKGFFWNGIWQMEEGEKKKSEDNWVVIETKKEFKYVITERGKKTM